MSTLALPRDLPRSRPFPWEPLGLVLLGAVWGCTPLLIGVVVDHVAPLWLVTGRVWSGLAVVLVVLKLRGARLPRDPRVWLHLTVLGTVGTALPWVLLREPLSTRTVLGMIIVGAGVWLPQLELDRHWPAASNPPAEPARW